MSIFRSFFIWYRCKYFHKKIFPFVKMVGFCTCCHQKYIWPLVSQFSFDKE